MSISDSAENFDYEEQPSEDFTAPRFGGGAIDNLMTARSCSGHLTLSHTIAGPDSSLELRSLKRSVLRNKKSFPNLSRGLLRPNRKLIGVETTGNCCWKLSSMPFHRGRSEQIGPGFQGLPQIPIKSIKLSPCDYVKF